MTELPGAAPLVSVIVPCYNVEAWVERSVRSLLAGDYCNTEVVCVDDGSTDSTPALLDSLARADGRVHVSHQANRGVSAARNVGLGHASGEYVAFLDPDDLALPNFVSASLRAMLLFDADFCVAGYERIEGGDEPSVRVVLPKEDYNCSSNGDIMVTFFRRLLGRSVSDLEQWTGGGVASLGAEAEEGMVWRCMYRRSLIEKAGVRFDERISLNEDSCFTLSYLVHARRMVSVCEPIYRYYLRPQGALSRQLSSGELLRNKAELKRFRDSLADSLLARDGVDIVPLYAGSTVLSLIQMLAHIAAHPSAVGWEAARSYFDDPKTRRAISLVRFNSNAKLDACLLFLKTGQLRSLYLLMRVASRVGMRFV